MEDLSCTVQDYDRREYKIIESYRVVGYYTVEDNIELHCITMVDGTR